MPVRSRLSFEDRRRIAEGLRDGLTYAEIARRLGRPRSTVSREISRNGGPHGYRAHHAQQATNWRARRRRPVSPPEPPDTYGDRDARTVQEFTEDFTAMMIQTGMSPLTARVFAALFVSDGASLTAAELVQRLHVSPASISKAIRWLEQRGLVGREREVRRERYAVDVDVWYRTWSESARSMALWADTTRRGAGVFGTGTPVGMRLHTTSRFFELLSRDMAQAAEHWRQALSLQRLS